MHKYNLQPTIDLKTPLQRNFGNCSERKECCKKLKIPKKTLQISPFFKPYFKPYWPAIHNFAISQCHRKQNPTKMFPLSVLK